jgi:hypothetical protein
MQSSPIAAKDVSQPISIAATDISWSAVITVKNCIFPPSYNCVSWTPYLQLNCEKI